MIYVQCKHCDVIYPANREHVCVQNSKPTRKPTTKPVTPTETKNQVSSQASEPSGRIDQPPKPGFDRKAYQRDYMRGYRARKKAQE
jgi:hypothetical protein